MEEPAQGIGRLACDLCPGKPLGEEGRFTSGISALHMVAASDRDGVIFSLSAGNRGDGPEGRALLRQFGPAAHPVSHLMDRAYKGDKTRALTVELGYIPVVPPKSSRKNPWDWDYDKELYKQRNQVERLFRRMKRFRRIFTRYDQLDVVFKESKLCRFGINSLTSIMST